MRIAACFLTDARGWNLARYAIGSFMLSQTAACDVVLACIEWPGPAQDDPLFGLGRAQGKPLILRHVSSNRYGDLAKFAHHMSAAVFQKPDVIAETLRSYDRVVYSDTDILFLADAGFERLNLGAHHLGAVLDIGACTGRIDPAFPEQARRSGLSARYFNTGLMVFDHSEAVLARLVDQIPDLMRQHQASCRYFNTCGLADQCAFNLAFMDAFTDFPLSLNAQSAAWPTRVWRKAAVRHFTGPHKFLPVRPWRADWRECTLLHRLGRLFRDPAVRIGLRDRLAEPVYRLRHLHHFGTEQRLVRQVQAMGAAG